MPTKLVIDTSSIRDFFKFYRFDKFNENKVYGKLYGYLLSKIKAGEIVVIDKVYQNELPQKIFDDFKKDIKESVVGTIHLIPKVQELIDKYYIESNAKLQGLTENEVESELKQYEEKHADLFLIALCLELKSKGENAILVTEESFRPDKKLVEKIPTICKPENENIQFQKIPDILFEKYKKELQFTLEVSPL